MSETLLSTSRVAQLLSVSEATVKGWADAGALACTKTPGGSRRFTVATVVEFAKRFTINAAGMLAMNVGAEASERIAAALSRRDMEALAAEYVFRALEAEPLPLLAHLYQHNVPTWEIYDRIVRNGMRMIGDRWMAGTLCVNEEHIASHATQAALAVLQTQVFKKPPTGRTVVCATPGGELHEIGVHCVGYFFEQEGWTVVQLGANVPADEIIAAVKRTRPHTVSISITTADDPDAQVRELMHLHHDVIAHDAQLLVGGQGAAALYDRLHGNIEGVFTSIESLSRHVHLISN